MGWGEGWGQECGNVVATLITPVNSSRLSPQRPRHIHITPSLSSHLSTLTSSPGAGRCALMMSAVTNPVLPCQPCAAVGVGA